MHSVDVVYQAKAELVAASVRLVIAAFAGTFNSMLVLHA
jgi:hypothetical protein